MRYFSGSGVSNASTITKYVMCGNVGPSQGSCHGCGVGAIRKPSSCTSVRRIMEHHCDHVVRRRAPLPSLVVASNNGKRVRIMERIVRSRLRLRVPVTNLTGSSHRHAGRLLCNFPPRAVTLPPRDRLFGILARVRSRMRECTVAFRHSGQDGRTLRSRLSSVGNVNPGTGRTLLDGFGDIGGVGRTSRRRLSRMLKPRGTRVLTGCFARGD